MLCSREHLHSYDHCVHTGDGWGMQGGAPNGLGGGANSGMSGPPMGSSNQGNQGNMGGNKTTTQVTIPKDVSGIKKEKKIYIY